jgi:cellulose synthase/poly-beta-1,6-N-acetylglucosamine synthase-like glycosyltransferase
MMTDFITILVIAFSAGYIALALFTVIGESRVRPRELPPVLPMVSVILCARNEEQNVRRCLESLLLLDYPREKLEIFVVDDESEDRTLEIFREFAARDERFHVLSTTGMSREISGKQRPLNLGISKSSGEFFLITDADCTVGPGWVKEHLRAYHDDVGIVGGITRIDASGKGLYAIVQSCDLIFLISFAKGSAGWGFPITIMGNNISIRREAYEAVGGFGKMKPRIVEDMALMNTITRQTSYRLGWIDGKEGVVVSVPESKFDTFIEQRRRWLNELWDIPLIGRFMIGYGGLMDLCSIAALMLIPVNTLPLIVNIITWYLGVIIILSKNPGGTFRDILFIPLMIIFQVCYSTVIIYRSILARKKVKWKGREY